MKFNLILTVIVATLSLNVAGHEDHIDTSLKSMHGGIVKKTSNAFIEVVQEEGKTEIFITGHDYKNIVSPKLELKAVAETMGKKLPLVLAIEKDHYVVTTDLKKSKHFKLNVFFKNSGREEKASFALENQ